MKFLVLLMLVYGVVAVPFTRPSRKHDLTELDEKESSDVNPSSLPKCYDLVCPSGTVGCTRVTKTSKDKQTLLTTIECEDYNGRALKSDTSSKPNPLQGAVIQSYSHSRVFGFSHGEGQNTRHVEPVDNLNQNADEIETF